MKAIRLYLCLAAIWYITVNPRAHAASIQMTCTLTKSGNSLTSQGTARYMDGWGNYVPHAMSGNHEIISPWPLPTCSYTTWQTATEWSGTIGCGGESGYCYRAYANAYSEPSFDPEQGMGSPRRCIDVVVEPPCGAWDCDGPPENCPLVVQVGNGPWRLTGLDNPVVFDIDADGEGDTIGWTAQDSSLALIALDLNGNGKIDDARELFGNHTMLPNGLVAANGFVALQQYDTNDDRWIDQSDTVWSRLLLWEDLNHDGRSQPTELSRVGASKIAALGIEYKTTRRRDSHGNTFRYKGSVVMKNGQKPYYDVFFVEH